MGDGLVSNLLLVCCLLATIRIALVLIYLSPEIQDQDRDQVYIQGYHQGYIPGRSLAKRADTRSADRQDAVGIKDDREDVLRKSAEKKIGGNDEEDGENSEESEKDEFDGGSVDENAIPAEEVSQNFDMMPKGGCPKGGRDIFLLTLVHSLPPHFAQREAIRGSWARNASQIAGKNVRVLFVAPGVSPRTHVMDGLRKEATKYNDIIHSVAGDSVSPYRPSTKVFLSEMGWTVNFCPSARFVLFAHDELFVNFEKIIERLKLVDPIPFRTFVLGRVKKYAKVERDKAKWDYVSEAVYPRETYPNYCVGGAGFVMSSPLIKQLHPRAVAFNRQSNIFPASDIMVGIVGRDLQVTPRYHEEFRKSGGEANYCDLRDTLTLGDFNTPSLMRGAWGNSTDVTNYCPSSVPNATELDWWTKGVDNRPLFEDSLQLLHKPRNVCNGKNISLLALVSTHPANTNLRSAIRVTWGNPEYTAPLNVRVVFVLGKSKIGENKNVNIGEESYTHGDIIQANFFESFHNLTMKVILGLRWVSSECQSARFIYKGDDDMLVNFEHMTAYLSQLPSDITKTLFMGNLMTNSPVIRTPSKYQVRRDVYPFKFFLSYFSGGGYIMSAEAVRRMSRKAESTRLIPIDDAYAGILARRAGIPLKHAGGFIVGGSKRDSCRLRRAFNMHGFKRTTVLIGTWRTFRSEHSCEEDKHKGRWDHIE